jgi:hypothetical protein
MSRKSYNRVIGALLAIGAIGFVMLLGGVGSQLLTRAPLN